MRNRSRVVIIQDGKLALIKRVRDGRTYYSFPGGGVERGETLEQAATREAYEELGVRVEIGRLVAIDQFDGFSVHFYLAKIVGGVFGTGTAWEFKPGVGRGTYEPTWVPLAELSGSDVRPGKLAAALANGQLSGDGPVLLEAAPW